MILDIAKKFPLLSRVVAFVLFPVALMCYLVYESILIGALPRTDGVVQVKGLESEVRILRNADGVAHIEASNDTDVYFSMGYLHAQDRLWQLELQRRISQGRLSEIFGQSMIRQDSWIRTLGVYQAATDTVPYLSKDALASLESYAAGINAWLKASSRLPVEFSAFSVTPEPWTVVDSLAWMKIFALNLAGNYRDELQQLVGLHYLTTAQMKTVFPHFVSDAELTRVTKPVADLDHTLATLLSVQHQLESELKIGGSYIGSNAWVVSGQHTQSGKPILANDPHLGLQLPSLWYAVSQQGATFSAAGMSLVGTPLVILGKNDQIAWGATNMMADVQDLYLEQLNPGDPTQYLADGRWQKFISRSEKIHVKADFPAALRAKLKPVEINIQHSIHGPVISGIVNGIEQPVAMQWTALEPKDTSYEAFYRLSRARDWAEFKVALSVHVAPALNFLYADKQNNIGMVGAGKIPIRKKGTGDMPVSGTDPTFGWQGYVAADELPQYFNPETGYIINANNSNVPPDYPYFISNGFAKSYRADRIGQLLKASIDSGDGMTSETMKKIQMDVTDLSVARLAKRLRQLNVSEEQQTVQDVLARWDGTASRNSVGASIFYGWVRHIRNQVFLDELTAFWNTPDHGNYLAAIAQKLSNDELDQLLEENSIWCDNVSTQVTETCEMIQKSALQTFVQEMVKLVGADIDEWRWGDMQHTVYAHTPFSHVKLLKDLFERRTASGGSENTIDVASSTFDNANGYLKSFGAGFRQVISLHEGTDNHYIMNSTGQSGQMVSPYYDNMVERFAQGGFSAMPGSGSAGYSLIFRPEPADGVEAKAQ